MTLVYATNSLSESDWPHHDKSWYVIKCQHVKSKYISWHTTFFWQSASSSQAERDIVKLRESFICHEMTPSDSERKFHKPYEIYQLYTKIPKAKVAIFWGMRSICLIAILCRTSIQSTVQWSSHSVYLSTVMLIETFLAVHLLLSTDGTKWQPVIYFSSPRKQLLWKNNLVQQMISCCSGDSSYSLLLT